MAHGHKTPLPGPDARVPGLAGRSRPGRSPSFTALQAAQIKALACQLSAETGAPLSRWSCPELAPEAMARGIATSVSASTVHRWLDQDALRPWQHRSWTGSEPSKTATTPRHIRSSGSSPPPTWTICRAGSTGTLPITHKNPPLHRQRDQPPKGFRRRPLTTRLTERAVCQQRDGDAPRRWDLLGR
ncbi:helix-turn-helix domain-containing protein [Streptomyces noursei]|uniref:helix-turn-helix domain-containing protein n=1 Tax=Streptomyces noursei TaxID=1971 RepID=UPI001E396D5E|nr:helix-turn-helix domain-containing protein [Streptomyces noursei]MCZ1012976.1 helix-turn-helix domain-containing protein [Streptomyces noursei]